MTLEQKRAIAMASARARAAEAEPEAQTAPPDPLNAPTGADIPPALASMGYGDLISGAGRSLDKAVRLAAGGATFGLADKFAGGMDYLTGRAPSYDEGVKAQRAETEAIRKAAPIPAAAAEAVGGLGTGVGLMKSGATLAGRLGTGILPRVLGYGAEGAAYGGAHGAGNVYSDNASDYIEAAKKGATTGALIGGALPVLGAAAGGAYRAGSAFLGPRIEGASRGASSLLRSAAQADEAGLRGLSSMGPEAMLVDAGPAMRGLGQGAGTGTGPGRTALQASLESRDAGTGKRLAETLETNLGPAPIPSRVEAELASGRKALSPEYESAFEKAKAVDTESIVNKIDEVIPNVRGEARARLNKVRDDLHITDAAGNTQVPDPHPRTLLAVRQSIDGELAGETNSNVRRALGEVRKLVDDELAAKVPGIKAADAKYAELKKQSEALERGQQILDTSRASVVRPAELVDELGSMSQGQRDILRQGTRAELDRLVGTNVNDLNALERKIGTPQDWNSQKLGTIFGEGPVANVAKALMDNRKFRQSYQDIVQGSQSAQRLASSKTMEGTAGGNVPIDTTLTGIGLKAVNLIAKALSGASNAKTKDEIGTLLASKGPSVERIAQELLRSAKTAASNSRALSGLVGSQRWISALSPIESRSDNRSKTR